MNKYRKGNEREHRQEESQVWREDDDLSLGLAETEGSGEIWTQEPEQRSLAQGLEFTLCMR